MSRNQNPRLRVDSVIVPMAITLLLWVVFWIETRFRINLNGFGIFPREISGLQGILFGPFIHGSLEHLFNNSVPLFVLLLALFYFYREMRWKILLYGMLLTGLLTWGIGRPSLHIGASGIIYMLVAFIFFNGILSRQYQLIALALVVVFLYGGLWWYVFPIDPKISWEGHLSGFMVGLIFALFFRAPVMPRKTYEWERPGFDEQSDPFIRQFDDNGNFIGDTPKQIPTDTSVLKEDNKDALKIVYSFKENEKTID